MSLYFQYFQFEPVLSSRKTLRFQRRKVYSSVRTVELQSDNGIESHTSYLFFPSRVVYPSPLTKRSIPPPPKTHLQGSYSYIKLRDSQFPGLEEPGTGFHPLFNWLCSLICFTQEGLVGPDDEPGGYRFYRPSEFIHQESRDSCVLHT